MIDDLSGFFINKVSGFDVILVVIMLYSIIQCFVKGFSLSFISFMKWILALVITIFLVPRI